jgi:hypothetical protein
MTSESGPANAASALQVLKEEVEKEIDVANRAVTDCLARGDHGEAEKSLQRSKALTAFRDKVAALAGEWEDLSGSVERGGNERIPGSSTGRLKPTPLKEYIKPILQVLEKMGGSGEADVVVERVGRAMKPMLREVDYNPLKSDGMPRWRKNVHWARHRMVKEDLLNPYSRRGIWEISEKGRTHLGL